MLVVRKTEGERERSLARERETTEETVRGRMGLDRDVSRSQQVAEDSVAQIPTPQCHKIADSVREPSREERVVRARPDAPCTSLLRALCTEGHPTRATRLTFLEAVIPPLKALTTLPKAGRRSDGRVASHRVEMKFRSVDRRLPSQRKVADLRNLSNARKRKL